MPTCAGPGPHLLGTAVKLENTYLAIISRHVSVSSKWRFFKLSSAWATEFSSADPKLALVRDVWILLEGGTMARSGHWAGPMIYHGDQRWRHACAERAKPERPRQCTWPLEPQLGQQSGHVTPERKCRSSWETQTHSWEQRHGRQEIEDIPSPEQGELAMASWRKFSHAETARPRDARTKIAFCPQGLPSRTGRVWASCVALPLTLRSPCAPHAPQGPDEGGLCRFNSDTNPTSPLPCFVQEKS